MGYIIQKGTKQFLLVYMIPQITIKNFLLFCVLNIKKMNQSKYVKNLSKYETRLITKIRGTNVKKSGSKIELFRILKHAKNLHLNK